MRARALYVAMAGLFAFPANAGLFSAKAGDKLLECQLQKASEIDPSAQDITGSSKFAALFPVDRGTKPWFSKGEETVDTTKIRIFDPAVIFGGMKINVYIDQSDKSGFIAGAVIAPQPLMLIISPGQPKNGKFFSAVIPVDQMTLQPKGDFQWGGWCSIEAGDAASSRFEAMK